MSKKRQKQPVQRNLSVEKFNIKESRRHLLEPVQILPFLTLSLFSTHPSLYWLPLDLVNSKEIQSDQETPY